MTVTTPAVANRVTRATERVRGSPSIDRRRIKERDASRRDFEVRLLEDETLEEVLTPEFLGHAADRLGPGDRVAVLAHKLSWWAELLVVDTDVALSSVRTVLLLGPVDLAPRIAAAAPFDLSKIKVEPVNDTFRLRHGTKVVADGFRSRSDAEKHLEDIRAGRKAASPR